MTIAFARQEAAAAHQSWKDAERAKRRAKQQELLRVPRPPQCRINVHGPPYRIIELSKETWWAAENYGYSYDTIRFVWSVVVEIMYRAEGAMLT